MVQFSKRDKEIKNLNPFVEVQVWYFFVYSYPLVLSYCTQFEIGFKFYFI